MDQTDFFSNFDLKVLINSNPLCQLQEQKMQGGVGGRVRVMVFNATFNKISVISW
jgi:hypothetical protein